MNNFLRWACVAVIFTAAVSCGVPSKAWNGTWKLNVSKSHIPGNSFIITTTPAGEYHFDDGTNSFNFRCDGKEYPTVANRTLSCIQKSEFLMDSTSKENGKIAATIRRELSADGKMLTHKGTVIRTDGSVKSIENVYTRTSGSMGFAGGWRNTYQGESHSQMRLALSERSLHLEYIEHEQYYDLPLDGSDAMMHGQWISQGLTMSIKPHGPWEFLTFLKQQGEVLSQGSMRVSPDGRTLIEEYWRPDKPDERAVFLYEKQ
jgi:hypothetical protein